MHLIGFSDSERGETVTAFDALYSEMERALWCLSQRSRNPLVEGRSSEVVEEFIWAVKSWWPVQGVARDTKTVMAEALASLDWSPELFDQTASLPLGGVNYASDLVTQLVKDSIALGVRRREFSLAAKVLHWLLPWRIPAYDSFVCNSLRVQGFEVPPADEYPEETYRAVVKGVFAMARRVEEADRIWLGSVEPRSLLRGVDKFLWWHGGGKAGTAPIVRDPWRIVRRLGLDCAEQESSP